MCLKHWFKEGLSVEGQPPACQHVVPSEQVLTGPGLSHGDAPLMKIQTETTENITFPQTTYVGGNMLARNQARLTTCNGLQFFLLFLGEKEF